MPRRKKEVFYANGQFEIKEVKGVHKLVRHFPVEFHFKDIIQVMVGATILAIPVAFTEETWRLGFTLPIANVLAILAISLFFISVFTYYTYYRNKLEHHWLEFLKRSLSTYVISFCVVGIILTLIQQTPWGIDTAVAIKRIILVSFPASMSAAVADTIK